MCSQQLTIELDNTDETAPTPGQYAFTYTRPNTMALKPPKLICMTVQEANYRIFNECFEYLLERHPPQAAGAAIWKYHDHETELLDIARKYRATGVYKSPHQISVGGVPEVCVENLWDPNCVAGDYLYFQIRFVQVRGTVAYFDVARGKRYQANVPRMAGPPPFNYVPQWTAVFSSSPNLSPETSGYVLDDDFLKLELAGYPPITTLAPLFYVGRVVSNPDFTRSSVDFKRARVSADTGEERFEGFQVLQTSHSTQSWLYLNLQ